MHVKHSRSQQRLRGRRVRIQLLPAERDQAQHRARRGLQGEGQDREASRQQRLGYVEQHLYVTAGAAGAAGADRAGGAGWPLSKRAGPFGTENWVKRACEQTAKARMWG